MTMEKWKGRKEVMEFLSDTGWTYHGMSAHARKTRTPELNKYWQRHTSDKYGLRGDMSPYVRRPFAAVPKAIFSFAMTVMDKVEGWNEEELVGSNFVACMWIYTKTVLCDGRRSDKPLDLESIPGIIVASVTGVTEGSLWEHEWITDTNVTLKENDILEALDYEIDVPCPLQWRVLWLSAPTNLNRKFVNNGTKVEKFIERRNAGMGCLVT